MSRRTLTDWLRWQESLHPSSIDLGLQRVEAVVGRLGLRPPPGQVLTVAGTNGKGSTLRFVESLLDCLGRRAGVYTSPHLIRYNERIRIDGREVGDAELVAAFEAVEQARRSDALTYFEFGTLAAFWLFSEARLDAWLLEIGLGGRLDAVNVVDADVALITTVALDHQQWLGDGLEQIAAEKAGIMRAGRPVFYGDAPVPVSIVQMAGKLDAPLNRYGYEFDFERQERTWNCHAPGRVFTGLPLPPPGDDVQLRNASLAIAGANSLEPEIPDAIVREAIVRTRLPAGRFQVVNRSRQWVLDVAHNPQAAALLSRRLHELETVATAVVIGMMADKDVAGFIRALNLDAQAWICCSLQDQRALPAPALMAQLKTLVDARVTVAGDVAAALEQADGVIPEGGRVLVCGSFHVVGPALDWLGLY